MRSRHIVLAAIVLVLFSLWVLALSEYAGDTDPTNPPGSTYSYTLNDIYNRLNAGADGSQNIFTEPAAGPGTPTMHTLNDIMDKAPVADNTDGVTKADVANGKKYWSLRTDGSDGSSWGLETGTLNGGCTCTGTLNNNRFCNNGDGTVTDLMTCLVWLKKADWGGEKKWDDCTDHGDAHTRAGLLCADSSSAGLSDGSVVGDWRLPTKPELWGLTHGKPAVTCPSPGPCYLFGFTGVQAGEYWSSSSIEILPSDAWIMDFDSVFMHSENKNSYGYVWPVRAGQ